MARERVRDIYGQRPAARRIAADSFWPLASVAAHGSARSAATRAGTVSP